jgi:uncharacterized GH25 family protein
VTRILRPALAVVLLFLLGRRSAAAHEYWLEPSAFHASEHDTVTVAAFAGTGFRGEQKPYAAPRTVRLTLTGPRVLDLTPGATNGDLTFSRFLAPDDGGMVVAYESTFTPIQLAAPEFDRHLELEGLDATRAARARLGDAAGPGRERYARCAKVWIAGREPARVTTPLGLRLELVPLNDPSSSSRLRVRVLYAGHPLARARVRAWRQPLARVLVPTDAATRDSVGAVAEARTDAAGVATLRLVGAGEWLLSSVHMVPSEDRAAADWQSLWASLTFARATAR